MTLRVAIIGSGPAAFYAAEALLKQTSPAFSVDMIERLPTPYGLVRAGVAPDHQKIKSVIAIYEKIAANPAFRYFGNVEFGKDVSREDLARHFHAALFATGAASDRSLGIPGENLRGSHSATEFVGWYNAHPYFRDRQFDLSQERVAVIGVGNVAIDVARILSLSADELRTTDMADHAIEALSKSKVRDVSIVGRRAVAQAAFTTVEVKELGELTEAEPVVRPDEVELDPITLAELESARAATRAKIEIVQEFSRRAPAGKPRKLRLRFFTAPLEILGDAEGRVRGIKLARTRLARNEAGVVVAELTDQVEELPVGLVFRSVGYRGVALPGMPFDPKTGLIPNAKGRVLDAAGGTQVPGLYASGWIKRGPSGVIGNNKACSVETVNLLLEDAAAGTIPTPEAPDPAAFAALLAERQPRLVTFDDWRKLDHYEVERGAPLGRPRVKVVSVEEMLEAIGK
jgi:ferredoxin--NADP+ reductase